MKKLCKCLYVLIILFLFQTEISLAENKTLQEMCDPDEVVYSKKMGYSSKEAVSFGKQILSAFKKKNIENLYSLFEGELLYGPRRSFALQQGFEKIFSEEWLKDVVAESPPCAPVGWRGFMIANGSVWFDKHINGKWQIRSILGAKEAPA